MKFRGKFETSGIEEYDRMCGVIRDSMDRSMLTASWLLRELGRQGIHIDNTALSMILHGKRCGPKPVEIVRMAYAIICSYEEWDKEIGARNLEKETPPLYDILCSFRDSENSKKT